jgi:hypothetical protein
MDMGAVAAYGSVHKWSITLFCHVRNAASGMICEVLHITIIFLFLLLLPPHKA